MTSSDAGDHKTRILVVDDHAITREGIRSLLQTDGGMQVIGMASNGMDAVFAAYELRPDMVIMDLVLPDASGIEVAEQILQVMPLTLVVILSASHTNEHMHRAARAGAHGFVSKASASTEILQAVKDVVAGKRHFNSDVEPLAQRGDVARLPAKSPLDRLSAREMAVLRRIVAGASSAEIATQLGLSRKTIDTYRSRLMVKLGVADRSALLRFAVAHSIAAQEASSIIRSGQF